MAELRVMTWNVQNLFEVGEDDGPDTVAEFEAKVASLVAVIDQAQPHVLALQELGPEPALIALQNALGHQMPHRAIAPPDGRGIRVGFLSTRVLHDAEPISLFPPGLLPIQASDDPAGPDGPRLMNQMGRPALQVRVRANNTDVHVISCHLKSKLLTFPTGNAFVPTDEDQRARYGSYALFRRASEATTLRAHMTALIDDRGRTMPVILAGDMNDEVDAATTQILNGPTGSEIGTAGFPRQDQGDSSRMFNLAPLIPEEQRFSRLYRGRPELIDHIFASHFLASGHTESVGTATAVGQLPSITDDPNERRGDPGSDHAAVMATFDW